jgi:hypothetical protein
VDHVKIMDVNICEAQKPVVADPELYGCALRDSGGGIRIAEQVCPFGNGHAASTRLAISRIAKSEWRFANYAGRR